MIRSFVSDSFLFFLSHSLVIFLCLRQPAREFRSVGERQGYRQTKTFWGFTTILWWESFPEPIEIVMSPRQSIEIYLSNFRWVMSLKFIVCSVGIFSEVCLAEVATNRTCNLSLSTGLGKHVCYLASSRGEKRPFK